MQSFVTVAVDPDTSTRLAHRVDTHLGHLSSLLSVNSDNGQVAGKQSKRLGHLGSGQGGTDVFGTWSVVTLEGQLALLSSS